MGAYREGQESHGRTVMVVRKEVGPSGVPRLVIRRGGKRGKKPKGWPREPARHAASARGVKTAQRAITVAKSHLKQLPSSFHRQEARLALDDAELALLGKGPARWSSGARLADAIPSYAVRTRLRFDGQEYEWQNWRQYKEDAQLMAKRWRGFGYLARVIPKRRGRRDLGYSVFVRRVSLKGGK